MCLRLFYIHDNHTHMYFSLLRQLNELGLFFSVIFVLLPIRLSLKPSDLNIMPQQSITCFFPLLNFDPPPTHTHAHTTTPTHTQPHPHPHSHSSYISYIHRARSVRLNFTLIAEPLPYSCVHATTDHGEKEKEKSD